MGVGLARLFSYLASMMRRLATAFDRVAGRPDPAIALLLQRFPGAPEHWLRDIAERAPHLAETLPLQQPAAPLDRPRPSHRRSPPLTLVEDVHTAVKPPLQPQQSEAPPRPELTLRSQPAAKPNRMSLTPERRPEAPAPCEPTPKAECPRPRLRLTLAARQAQAAARDERQDEMAVPKPAAEPVVARAPTPAVQQRCTAPVPQHSRAVTEAHSSQTIREAIAAPLWSEGKATQSARRSQPHVAKPQLPFAWMAQPQPVVAKPQPPFAWTAPPQSPRAPLQEIAGEMHWPELPPPATVSVREEPVPPSGFEALRREQEEGSWSA